MKMTIESHVAAPRDLVFATYTDLERAAERIAGIERVEVLTDGPVGVGTRFKETRVMFKKETTEEMEVTAFDSPGSYTLEADSCGAHFKTDHDFTEKDGGTQVTLELTSRANSFGAKLLSPVGFLFAGSMKKMIQKDLDQMKAFIEERASTRVS